MTKTGPIDPTTLSRKELQWMIDTSSPAQMAEDTDGVTRWVRIPDDGGSPMTPAEEEAFQRREKKRFEKLAYYRKLIEAMPT